MQSPHCPRCRHIPLEEANANGVVVDYCKSCLGVFLDPGELAYYSRGKGALQYYREHGLLEPRPSELTCPKCGGAMQEGGLLQPSLRVDVCERCRGLWFDNKELKTFSELSRAMGEVSAAKDQGGGALVDRGGGSPSLTYRLDGTIMQTVELTLSGEQRIFSESGGMCWMDEGVEMETKARGGFLKSIGRLFGGESFFLTHYRSRDGRSRKITFASEFPGSILPFHLAARASLIAQKDAFMVADDSVTLSVEFTKRLGAGLFGGEGFVLQRLTGPGTAFLEVCGELVERDLQKGETVLVDTGHVAAFDPTVEYDIRLVRGIKNVLFGGEGLFLAALTGPGRIFLQSMPVTGLARALAPYIRPAGGKAGPDAGSANTLGRLFDVFSR